MDTGAAHSTASAARRAAFSRAPWALALALAVLAAGSTQVSGVTLGVGAPAGFSLCEESTDQGGAPRPECQGGDLRFQGPGSDPNGQPGSAFGFAVASGYLNGDDLADLAVADPGRNRVYIFFGRSEPGQSYGLDAADLSDRAVAAGTQADIILYRDPAVPGQVGSFGFSLAIGRERVPAPCPPGDTASALLVGAPGEPGTSPNAPGSAFYLPAGALCTAVSNPPAATLVNPASLGQVITAPQPAQDDEFGYSVAFGRLLAGAGPGEDVIVGARNAAAGAGRVTVFPAPGGAVLLDPNGIVRINGQAGDGLGESMASGDLDLDYDPNTAPSGGADDLIVGAVGAPGGKVLLVDGPLSPAGGSASNGVYREGIDPEIQAIAGEEPGDFFGFSVAVSPGGRGAVAAIFAENTPPDPNGGGGGGDPLTNVFSGGRINAGKVYVWDPGILNALDPNAGPASADLVLVARRSGDQLGFALGFGDFDGSGDDDLVVAARREDGSGLKINEIDQGTAYMILNIDALSSPVDLNFCAMNQDCTGVAGVEVMLFGGDRTGGQGDQIGFSLAAGDINGDGFDDLHISSLANRRVYSVTIDDSDGDRQMSGRNLRDDDDDGDGDSDDVDCSPLDPGINSGATEIACNGVDENCNGAADDAPDLDGDGFDACGASGGPAADCDDSDPLSYPGGPEICDGNDNACSGSVPLDERDQDGDLFAGCSGWNDLQGDDTAILGGGDCDDGNVDTFPGAAPNEASPGQCMRDEDGDDFGDMNPPGGVTPGTDCDDGSSAAADTFPGAAPLDDAGACMKDVDGDDFGDLSASGSVTPGGDCDDLDPASHPGAPELCDGNDNACNGVVPAGEIDVDGDDYVACTGWDDVQGDNPGVVAGGDCDQSSADTFPGAAPSETFATACMRDVDGDEFGDLSPPPGVTPGTDCDDGFPDGPDTFPGAASLDGPLNCMKDSDGDEYGDSSVSLPVVAGADCDDTSPFIFPGVSEIPDDGVDQDCNGTDTVTCFEDLDLDGYGTSATLLADDGDCTDPGESEFDTDCNDGNPAFSPGAAEIPDDGIDQNCNGADTVTCILDADMDGSGTPLGTVVLAPDGSCDAADGESSTSDDCDDTDPLTFPGAPQVCDGNDNTCSAAVPVDETDVDGDLYVACSGWNDAQGDNPGIAGGGDCDETDTDTHPGAASNEVFSTACMRDKDGDDFGDISPPPGVVAGSDCDDVSPSAADTFPGAAAIDGPLNCMKDSDDDDYGDSSVSLPVVPGGDCDDSDPTILPGAPELCDGNDTSCSGGIAPEELDDDGDGFVECTGWNDTQGDNPLISGGDDCDDTDGDTFPGAAPAEPVPAACMRDSDGDDFGDFSPPAGVTPGTDCDDVSATAASTFPGAAQIEAPLNCMKDVDDDGWGDLAVSLPVVPGTDCADDDATRYPSAPEICGDMIDSDCDGADPSCLGPGPVIEISMSGPSTLAWSELVESTALHNVYRGGLDTLRAQGTYSQDPASSSEAARFCGLPGASVQDAYAPPPGNAIFYLVTSGSGSGESSLGSTSDGDVRPHPNPCP